VLFPSADVAFFVGMQAGMQPAVPKPCADTLLTCGSITGSHAFLEHMATGLGKPP
jgi:hypothetical protein